MIRRIYIDNYRCFSNFELRPGRATLLLGPNGAGKSSILDLLETVLGLTRTGTSVADAFPARSRTRWDARAAQRVELDVEVADRTFTYELVVEHGADDAPPLILSERIKLAGRVLFAFESGKVHLHNNEGKEGAAFDFRGTRSFLPQIERRPATRDLMTLLDFLDAVVVLRLEPRAIEPTSLTEEDVLARNGGNFASWYRHLAQESPERLPALWSSLAPVVPGLQALKLVGVGAGGRFRDLMVRLSTAGAEYELAFDELSDGQRALIVLYALLEGVRPGVGCLVLDEPEAHIGLTEVQPWLVALADRYADAGQFVVISHHPEVVDYLAGGEPILIERPDGGPARARSPVFDQASGLKASEQVARGLLHADH